MKAGIRISGFGGQGIILSGVIVGKAAVNQGFNAVQTQSYGPEARGGSTRSEVVISDEEIDYPKVESASVSIIMSQEAFYKYASRTKREGIIIYDPELIPDHKIEGDFKLAEINATRIASELGTKIVANIVMLGAFNEMCSLLSKDSMIEAIKDSIPKMLDLNLNAFEAGINKVKLVK
ncbi:MAG TPA: 2-oxoacid:acceptor oxidoreductase family protein [Methanofastidiosum sp.]|nr:2-oxoacid:acceptor oxidoreductase family protein [Methanofastidiosum sp.]HQK62743.1 2-oxoacid:acceptor oxidoreductase family protein [Methanofastidiosum sp.]HRZ19492.1 2-oxoacid:acceptor oxidoreductase family protein [Methanofastidiosum sp.]